MGGVIRNTEGEPIEGATVHLSADSKVYSGLPGHVAMYGAVPTSDAQGRWQSGEMPPDFGRVVIRLEHPDYVSDGMGSTARAPSAEALRRRTGVMVMSKAEGSLRERIEAWTAPSIAASPSPLNESKVAPARAPSQAACVRTIWALIMTPRLINPTIKISRIGITMANSTAACPLLIKA